MIIGVIGQIILSMAVRNLLNKRGFTVNKIDHKSHSWMAGGNRIVLTAPGTKTTIGKDIHGLTREQRRKVEERKDRLLYPELYADD